VNLSPTISVAFPNASVGSSDDINPATGYLAPKNLMLIGIALVGGIIVLRLFR
jgi:hypothetical protein